MTLEHFQRLSRLLEDRRDRVLERAAIQHEACGCTWEEADRMAIEAEYPPLPGVEK